MGTTWSVKLITTPGRDLQTVHRGIQQQLDSVVAQMSTWEPDSDISRYNCAPAGQWQIVPDAFWQVLDCACHIAETSQGAFDPTIGALVGLWGFGAQAIFPPSTIPDASQLKRAARACGWQQLQRNRQTQTLYQPGGLHLDLSAIAKGFAVDQVSQWLRQQKITAALVEVGGELYAYGRKPDGLPWRVLVAAAADEEMVPDHSPLVLILDNCATATSGDRWHRHLHNQTLYSHTLDPIRQHPVSANTAAVTVVHDQAMHADAWATALLVMGVEEGLAFAEKQHLAARFVQRTEHGIAEQCSSAFAAYRADIP